MASFATQVQIRRGTDAENDAFTGAEGEVTMDLTNKQLRVHDGQTTGGMKIPNINTVFGTNQIANNAVTEEKIADNAVTGGKIADGAVSLEKLGNNSVNTSKIVNGSITPEKLIGQPTFAGNAGKTLAVNPAGNGFELIESTLPENSDYVIATQLPSSENNWKWYRKYKSGWVEQGGFLPNKSGSGTIQLIIPLTSAPAVVSFVPVNNSGTPWPSGQANPEYNYSASSGTAIAYVVNDGRQQMFWWAAGMAA